MTPPSTPPSHPRLLDFFTLEATEYLSQLRAAVGGAQGHVNVLELTAAARGLRGAATMARLPAIARLAGQTETVCERISGHQIKPTADLERLLASTVDVLSELVRSVRSWGVAQEERAAAALRMLEPFAPLGSREPVDLIVPISDLFYADAGPHIVQLAATARTSFEQRLRGREPGPAQVAKGAGRLRGAALKDVLASSIATMGRFEDAGDTAQSLPVVPIQALLYKGAGAVSRASELRAEIERGSGPPSRDVFAELCDLVELAATE